VATGGRPICRQHAPQPLRSAAVRTRSDLLGISPPVGGRFPPGAESAIRPGGSRPYVSLPAMVLSPHGGEVSSIAALSCTPSAAAWVQDQATYSAAKDVGDRGADWPSRPLVYQ